MLPTYTFTITLNPISAALIFIQTLFVLFVFLMSIKLLYKEKKLNKLHLVFSVVPFLIGYTMDLIFSLATTWFFYLDRLHFKVRTFADKNLKEKIKTALNYIGDLTFTFQSNYHYTPSEEANLKGIKLYRHRIGKFFAMVLNPFEEDHIH